MNILLLLCLLSEPIGSQTKKTIAQFQATSVTVNVSRDIKYFNTGILDLCTYEKSNYVISDSNVVEKHISCPYDDCLNKVFRQQQKPSNKPQINYSELKKRLSAMQKP